MTFRRSLYVVLAVLPLATLIGCGEKEKGTDTQPSTQMHYGAGKPAGGGRPAPPAPPPIEPAR